MGKTSVKSFASLCLDGSVLPESWNLQVLVNGDNLTYLAFHAATREAIWVDPLTEDFDLTANLSQELGSYRFVAVIDTHTHADHLSSAGELARSLNAPLVMHRNAPSSKVDLRVSRDTHLSTAAGPLEFLITPGHTWDGLTPVWGPFVFTGDTVFYADTGRDDLPTGNPAEHFESLQKLKATLRPEQVVLPGHDPAGGRISSWETQLRINPALRQSREEYLQDGGAWVGNPPKLLKESLFHNFK
jgi:glyoxylase-like metal-dependent hydrolase (beta-lactamase superfamily II)